MALTNDEYHDILDSIKAAKHDFRYANEADDGSLFEVEAYQITARSRFENDEWPAWLQMQKSPNQVNRVYCESHSPNDLTLLMSDGSEQPLGATDWLVIYKNGDITVLPERDFKNFDKVVPVPVMPALGEELAGFEEMYELDENNKLIPRVTPLEKPSLAIVDDVPRITPEMVSTIVSRDYEELEAAIGDSIEMLQDPGDNQAVVLERLKDVMGSRTVWCNCVPGSCDDSETFGCRAKSPLLR